MMNIVYNVCVFGKQNFGNVVKVVFKHDSPENQPIYGMLELAHERTLVHMANKRIIE